MLPNRPVNRTARARSVALAFPIAPAHLFAVTRGVTDYATGHGRWLLTTHGESANLPIQQLRGWRGDGIIAILTSDADVRAARRFARLGIPVVTFSGTISQPNVPRVRTHSTAIGRLAAEHLLKQGYRSFGLFGLQNVAYSDERIRAFVERIAGVGEELPLRVFAEASSATKPWENQIRALSRWLRTLKLPAGLFAVNDYRAQLLLGACDACGLRVPEQIGIVGTDNNLVICEFSSPKLSSVDCNWRRVGERSAELLDHLMNGGTWPGQDWLVEPLGVAQRESTDRIGAQPRVRTVVEFIREHLHERFGVERLLAAAKCPRRTLELAFARELKCSPYEFLARQRVERARRLLESSRPMNLSEISARCGFPDLRRFREVFRRVEGIAPADFRMRRRQQ